MTEVIEETDIIAQTDAYSLGQLMQEENISPIKFFSDADRIVNEAKKVCDLTGLTLYPVGICYLAEVSAMGGGFTETRDSKGNLLPQMPSTVGPLLKIGDQKTLDKLIKNAKFNTQFCNTMIGIGKRLKKIPEAAKVNGRYILHACEPFSLAARVLGEEPLLDITMQDTMADATDFSEYRKLKHFESYKDNVFVDYLIQQLTQEICVPWIDTLLSENPDAIIELSAAQGSNGLVLEKTYIKHVRNPIEYLIEEFDNKVYCSNHRGESEVRPGYFENAEDFIRAKGERLSPHFIGQEKDLNELGPRIYAQVANEYNPVRHDISE